MKIKPSKGQWVELGRIRDTGENPDYITVALPNTSKHFIDIIQHAELPQDTESITLDREDTKNLVKILDGWLRKLSFEEDIVANRPKPTYKIKFLRTLNQVSYGTYLRDTFYTMNEFEVSKGAIVEGFKDYVYVNEGVDYEIVEDYR